MANDYISEFVGHQKEKSEKQRMEREAAIEAARIVLQEKVLVDTQAPVVWNGLVAYIVQKVAEVNAANGNALLAVEAPGPDELILQCGTRSLKLRYSSTTQLIQLDAAFGTKRKWRSLHPVTENERVLFAENTTKGLVPLSFDDIMKGLLSSFSS